MVENMKGRSGFPGVTIFYLLVIVQETHAFPSDQCDTFCLTIQVLRCSRLIMFQENIQ